MPKSKSTSAKSGKSKTRKHDFVAVSRVPPGLDMSGRLAKGRVKPLPLPGKSRGR